MDLPSSFFWCSQPGAETEGTSVAQLLDQMWQLPPRQQLSTRAAVRSLPTPLWQDGR